MSKNKQDLSGTKPPKGVGGWLILVAIGVVIGPLRLAYFVIATYPPIFADEIYSSLTTPGSPEFHPLWKPLLWGEVLINGGLVLLGGFLAVSFFRHKWFVPKLYLGLAAFSALFIVADAIALNVILPELPIWSEDTMKELARSLVSLCIWSPYLLLSARARNTFTA